MIKAELIQKVSVRTGVERKAVSAVLEMFMQTVKHSLEKGENVYLREFGTFAVKKKLQRKLETFSKAEMDILLQLLISLPITFLVLSLLENLLIELKKIINLIIVIN